MKLVSFILAVYWTISVFSGFAAGGGGVLIEPLTADISATDMAIPIADTSGWLNADVVIIGEEQIAYTSKTSTTLVVSQRGYDGTTAEAHYTGENVYTRSASVFNRMASYNVGVVAETDGWLAFIKIPIAVVTLLFTLFTVNLTFLGQSDWLRWAENAWSIFGIAMLIWFVLAWRSGRTV